MVKQNIVIIKYNAGNICSVKNSLSRLGQEAIITADHDLLAKADKVIFPGVGEASTTMHYLNKTGLSAIIKSLRQPVLGICLGMQLMCSHSEEGDVNCLGIFDQQVRKFRVPANNNGNEKFKIPQMGWNRLFDLKGNLLDPSLEGQHVYFVHGYYAPLGSGTTATTNYIVEYSSALQNDNFFATQFHPEKSGPVGDQILKNFLRL